MSLDLLAAFTAAPSSAVPAVAADRARAGKGAAGSEPLRTADSPFAVLLASAAVPARATGLALSRAPAAAAGAAQAPATPAAPAITSGLPAATTRAPLPVLDLSFGTPAPGLEPRATVATAAAAAALTPARHAAVVPVTFSSSHEPGVIESHPGLAAPSLPTELGKGDLFPTRADQPARPAQPAASAERGAAADAAAQAATAAATVAMAAGAAQAQMQVQVHAQVQAAAAA